MLSGITSVLPLSASLWMTVIGLNQSLFFLNYMCYFYSSLAKNDLQFQPGDAF